jgi:monoamine oxidase
MTRASSGDSRAKASGASDLSGASVLVAGAGLAGLTAAYDLAAMGAAVTVIEARERLGGRVWTIRDGFADRQHAEAGGDMIDESQHEIRQLADALGLKLARILRGGFGYARMGPGSSTGGPGRPRLVGRNVLRGWDQLEKRLGGLAERYRLAERRWDSPITADLARRSVAQWLDDERADSELRETATGLRGFFLADPEELSLLALVDQFAGSDQSGSSFPGKMFRIAGGNDRLPAALAARLDGRIQLATELVAVSVRGKSVHSMLKRGRTSAPLTSDYLVLALPASVLRRVPITPALPAHQHEAIANLKYGRATKTLLQFSRRFWRAPGRPRAFGSPLPYGAIWEGNEEQAGRTGILTLLAGGTASDQTQALVAKGGITQFADGLSWLGTDHAELGASRQVVWESDPLARGGYAFFDPSFDPALREWLARPAGRLFFAGEHTSIRWQGYMNGAVESGRRAAAEIAATARLGTA